MGKKNSDNEKSSSGGIKRVILVILVLIVIGAGSFAGYYFYMKSTSNVEKPIVEEKILVGQDMMIKLADEKGNRYLKATVNISYDKDNKGLSKELNSKLVEIKDKTLFYLMSKEADEYSASNEDNLKNGLIDEINKLLDEGKILNVYFDQLLTQ